MDSPHELTMHPLFTALKGTALLAEMTASLEAAGHQLSDVVSVRAEQEIVRDYETEKRKADGWKYHKPTGKQTYDFTLKGGSHHLMERTRSVTP